MLNLFSISFFIKYLRLEGIQKNLKRLTTDDVEKYFSSDAVVLRARRFYYERSVYYELIQAVLIKCIKNETIHELMIPGFL